MIQKIVQYIGCLIYGFLGLMSLLYLLVTEGFGIFKVKTRESPPNIYHDKKYGSHRFMALKKQGIKLHYVEKGDKDNPLLVCIHGYPECWFTWRHQIERFSKNFWVVAVDMRGFGDSDKPKHKSDYNMDLVVEDMREFISSLTDNKCILMCHDWGGPIGWQLSSMYPDMFTAHISINGPEPNTFFSAIGTNLEQTRKSWYIYLYQLPWLPETLMSLKDLSSLEGLSKKYNNIYKPEELELLKYYYGREGGFKYPINFYRNIFDYKFKPFTRSRVPTLILWGAEDTALSKKLPYKMKTSCEKADLFVFPGVGHFPHQEAPELVNNHIDDYFKNQKILKTLSM